MKAATNYVYKQFQAYYRAIVKSYRKNQKKKMKLKMFVMTVDNGCVCCRNPTFLLF